MLGKRIYKDNFNSNEYIACVVWCKQNNGYIEDKGNYYECVELPPLPPPIIADTPSLEERINDLELAVLELAGGL